MRDPGGHLQPYQRTQAYVGGLSGSGSRSEPIDVAEEIRDSGFRELPITFRHALVAGRLPLIHRDPFDRILVAQAQCEGLTLASRDPHLQRYGVALLPV